MCGLDRSRGKNLKSKLLNLRAWWLGRGLKAVMDLFFPLLVKDRIEQEVLVMLWLILGKREGVTVIRAAALPRATVQRSRMGV